MINPKRFRRLSSAERHADVHVAPVFYHLLAYRVVEAQAEVRVLAIRHEREHPERLLADIAR